jgi:hypothetical protein
MAIQATLIEEVAWRADRMVPRSGSPKLGLWRLVLMFWVFYSAQIFLFGAELTKAIDDARNPTPSEER